MIYVGLLITSHTLLLKNVLLKGMQELVVYTSPGYYLDEGATYALSQVDVTTVRHLVKCLIYLRKDKALPVWVNA